MSDNKEFDDILGGGAEPKSEPVNPVKKSVQQPAEEPARKISAVDVETYSDEELNDTNAIITNITDTQTPIAVFFGPASSGKTMALLRMIRFFIEELGFQVEADRTFRPSHDRHYAKMCNNLSQLVNSQFAPGNTDTISFMLVKIYDRVGNPVLQILEAPGEHYFDEKLPNTPFPAYIQNIIHAVPNRKVWVYFVEQDWLDQTDRNNYATKISEMQTLTPHDKLVFLFNKCDKKSYQYDRNGRPRKELFLKSIEQQYPGIFNRYSNSGIAKFLFGPYNFASVCFSSGSFSATNDGRQNWTKGQPFYCHEFWKAIR